MHSLFANMVRTHVRHVGKCMQDCTTSPPCLIISSHFQYSSHPRGNHLNIVPNPYTSYTLFAGSYHPCTYPSYPEQKSMEAFLKWMIPKTIAVNGVNPKMDFFFGWFGGTWPGKPPNLVPGDSRKRRNQSSQWTRNPNPASAVSPALSCCLGLGSSKQGICLDCGDRPNFSVPTHSHFMWNQLHPGTTLDICWLGICHIHFARYTVLICTNKLFINCCWYFHKKQPLGWKATVTWSNVWQGAENDERSGEGQSANGQTRCEPRVPNANGVDYGIKYDPHFLSVLIQCPFYLYIYMYIYILYLFDKHRHTHRHTVAIYVSLVANSIGGCGAEKKRNMKRWITQSHYVIHQHYRC